MLNGLKTLLFILVTATYAVSCVKGDNPITRPNNPRNRGGVPKLGAGWSKVSISNNCSDVFFSNDTVGYLAGQGVFRSVDGGVTWTKTNAQDLSYYNLYFLNDKFGWAVSNKSLAKTVDSGKTWQMNPTTSFTFIDVFFLDETNGFATASEGVLKSTDGGVSWTLLAGSPREASTVYFRDADNGFFATVGQGGFRTTDGGLTFSKIDPLPKYTYPTQFLKNNDPLKGFTMGAASLNADALIGDLYKTEDGGATWVKAFSLSDNYFDFHFSDFNTGFIMTPTFVYKVEGTTITQSLYHPMDRDIYFIECHFTDDLDRGWVVRPDGILYRYVKP